MNVEAFLPGDSAALFLLLGALAVIVSAGFGISRVPSRVAARSLAWALVVVSVVGIDLATRSEPAGYRMVAIILALLFSMKSACGVESAHSSGTRLNPLQWLVFCVIWFGMRPVVFASFPGPSRAGVAPLLRSGLLSVASGVVLVVLAKVVWSGGETTLSDAPRIVVATMFLLPGLSLLLHFGLFDLIAGAGRLLGADTAALFRRPLQSKSLNTFWSQRWNRGFSEMTSLTVYRPLVAPCGDRIARISGFLFSGLLHELAISVPPNAGYGLPTAYFLIQAGLLQIEARPRVRRFLQQSAFRARVWVGGSLLLPLPILFHTPFLSQCIWPLVGIER